MKWRRLPAAGTVRYRVKFCWLPCKDLKEVWHWLVWVRVTEEYYYDHGHIMSDRRTGWKWILLRLEEL